MNELIMICILLIGIASIYLFNRILDIFGIKIVFIIFSIISYIISFKYLALATFHINASVLTCCISYTCISILLEKNKQKDTTQLIRLNFVINVFISILLYMMMSYTQSINDTIGINMTNIIQNNLRYLIVYPISTYISYEIFIYIYLKVKKLYDYLFISMVSTYMAAGLINLIITYFISYLNLLKTDNIIKLLLSTYMVEVIIIVIYSITITYLKSKKVSK